jgi:hypothetical protein
MKNFFNRAEEVSNGRFKYSAGNALLLPGGAAPVRERSVRGGGVVQRPAEIGVEQTVEKMRGFAAYRKTVCHVGA